MSLTYNPLSGNLETKEPGPQGPAGTVSAAGDGSQGTPSISFASDTNTGLYKYAADSIGVSTNGTTKIVIDSSGRLGVGVTDPLEKLQVNGNLMVGADTTAGSFVDIISAGASQDFGIRMGSESDRDSKCSILSNTTVRDLRFSVEGSERMRLNSSGALKLGPNLPTFANISLNANGTADFASTVTFGGSIGTANAAYITGTGDVVAIRSDPNSKTFYSLHNTTTNAFITAGGAAKFAGSVAVGGGDPSANVSDGAIRLAADGNVQTRKDTTGEVFVAFQGGNSGSNKKAIIKSDGSAEFANAVQVGGDPNNGTAAGSKLYPAGGLWTARTFGSSAGLNIYQVGNSTPNVSILANGSASFDGDVSTKTLTADVSDDVNKSFGGIFRTNSAGSGDTTVYIQNRNNGGKLIAGNNSSSETFTVKADGSAEFDGKVQTNSFVSIFGPTGGNALLVRESPYTSSNNTAIIKTDGSAEFGGNVDFGSWKISNNSLEGARIYENGSIQTNRTSTGGGAFVGRLSGTVTSLILGDGSAEFASHVHAGETFNADVTKQGTFLAKEGGVYAMRPTGSTDSVFSGYQLGNTVPTAIIRANGSASFAGQITSGSDAFGTNNIGSGLTSSGSVIARRTNAENLWLGYQVGTSQQTSQIGADGSASFAGSNVNIFASGATAINRATTSATDSIVDFTSNIGGTKQLKHRFFADGSANFDNTIEIQDFNTSNAASGGTRVQSGILKLQRPSTTPDTASVLEVWQGTTNVAKILADGSGTFAGNVGIGATDTLTNKLFVDGGNVRIDGAPSTDAVLQIRGDNSTSSSTDAVLSFVSYANNQSGGSNADITVTNAGGSYGEMVFSTRRGSGSNTEAMRLTSTGDAKFAEDIETTTAAAGLILKSPNGTRYRLTVANDGTLTTSTV